VFIFYYDLMQLDAWTVKFQQQFFEKRSTIDGMRLKYHAVLVVCQDKNHGL